MKNIVYIAASLDGYIADGERGIAWLENIPNPGKSDYGYKEFIRGIDGIVMGRNSFEKVLSFGFWPYDKKVFVLSRTLESVPAHLTGKAGIVKGEIPEILSRLNGDGFSRLYIDGERPYRVS